MDKYLFNTGLNWTQIITESYWPVAILIALGIILAVFGKQISRLVFKTTYGEFLVEMNNEKHIIDDKYSKSIKHLDSTDIWILLDIKRAGGGLMISELNPVQKFAYQKMIKTPFLEKSDNKLVLTEVGENVIKLAESIEI